MELLNYVLNGGDKKGFYVHLPTSPMFYRSSVTVTRLSKHNESRDVRLIWKLPVLRSSQVNQKTQFLVSQVQ